MFKEVTIIDSAFSGTGEITNILINDGIIEQIGDSLEVPGANIIEEEGLCCSIGWFDLSAYVGEPGFEHRETIESFIKTAAYGGFTEVACLPNLYPITQSKGSVEYFLYRTNNQSVRLHPIAAATHQTEGNDLTELLDLHAAGAVAYSDGLKPIQAAGTLLKTLEYLKIFGGVLLNRPENASIATGGQIHEGLVSTQLGLKGIPAIAEEVQVQRDLQLVEYSKGRIHFSQISTEGSVHAIRAAKKRGLNVTCDMAAHQCAFIDETILPFDTSYKVAPPFRSQQDREALLEAIEDGTIDAIVSAHIPWDEESKELEFDLAEPGIIGAQTAFSIIHQSIEPTSSLAKVIDLLSKGPRKVLSLPIPCLAEGQKANLTFFNPTKKWVFTSESNASLSQNSPFLGSELEGCVYGTFFNNHFTLNPTYSS
nr:dihydroorotase [Rufibacter sp. LB8]